MIRLKRPPKGPAKEIRVRVNRVGEFGIKFPETAKPLFDWAMGSAKRRLMVSFAVTGLPPTVNHMYQQFGKRRCLTRAAVQFRDVVAVSMGANKALWRPSGVVMAMVFLESPYWLTKKYTIRDMDCDNRAKSLLDAIQHATGIPDFTNWELHIWKVPSSKERTAVYLFDLGDLVQWFA